MKNSFIVVLFFLFSGSVNRLYSCQCPVTVLSLQECEKYEVIFRGKILSIKTCENKPGEAIFEVQELYKGNAKQHFKVLFNCADECFYEFKPGEEWVIYSRYKQVNTALMDFCSRSRRLFNNSKEDYYASTSGNEYEDELKFLREKLGLHRLIQNDKTEDYSRNKLPNTSQSILIVLFSVGAILAFYFLFKRFVK